jgi:hypothetical protein
MREVLRVRTMDDHGTISAKSAASLVNIPLASTS